MEKQIRLIFSKGIMDVLLKDPEGREVFAFSYAAVSCGAKTVTGYPRHIVKVEEDDYIARDSCYLKLENQASGKIYFDFLREPDFEWLIAVHSHPFDHSKYPCFSPIDDRNDAAQAEHFYGSLSSLKEKYRNGRNMDYLFVVLGQKGLNARIYDPLTGCFRYLDQVRVFSERGVSYFFPAAEGKNGEDETGTEAACNRDFFSRTDAAFGPGLTAVMRKLRVGIAGLGGIGSVVAEGCARLGVRKITLFDPDVVERSNLNRLQGASAADTGLNKAEIKKRQLDSYFDDLEIITVKENIFSPVPTDPLARIKDLDFIFGCVDNHGTQHILNRIALQYLIPYIDGATRIISREDRISVPVRTGVVIPSVSACLDCSLIEYYDRKSLYLETASPQVKGVLNAGGVYFRQRHAEPRGLSPKSCRGLDDAYGIHEPGGGVSKKFFPTCTLITPILMKSGKRRPSGILRQGRKSLPNAA
jgi:hypothetical protein